MGSINEALAWSGAFAAKPKRGNPSPGPGPGPEPIPAAAPTPRPDEKFDGMMGRKGRWMFTPPEQPKVTHGHSVVSEDPTISSGGGPDSEVMSSDSSQSGHWILKPFGSLESMDGLMKQPQPSVSGLAGAHDPSVRKASTRERPSAPKPRVRRRSLMRQDSLLVPRPRAYRPSPHASDTERDALAISSAIHLAWKEAWDLPPVGPDPASPMSGKLKEEAAAPKEQKAKDRASDAKGPVSKSVREGKSSSAQSPPPSAGKDISEQSVSQTDPRASESKKPKSEQQPEERVTPFSEAAVTKEYGEEGPVILPRSLAPCVPKKGLLTTTTVCPVGICGDLPERRLDKYCPWRPHSSFNAWGRQRPNFPGWMSVEEEENISKMMGKERRIPCSRHKPKYVDAATTCCIDEFPPKQSKVKTSKVTGGKKTIRPELRRWLAGYPQATRYRREAQDLIRNPPEGMSAEIDETNERHIFVDMFGPDQSLYEGGLFRIEVFFPGEYPREPPQMRFMTKIYHPNIDKLGRIRLPEIEEKWSPGLLLREVLVSLQTLMANPDVNEPIAIDVARRWYWQESSAQQTARLWTRKFAHRHSAAAWLDCRCDCCCEQLAAVSVFI